MCRLDMGEGENMLTIAKITGNKTGYEVEKEFCIVRDAGKYKKGGLYVCKILNRFTDCKGNEHFVVIPISSKEITGINYELAGKIYNNPQYGMGYLIKKGYTQDDVENFYEEVVQEFLESLTR